MKIYDVASNDKFEISSTNGDLDYGHRIDSVIDEIFDECCNDEYCITKKRLKEGIDLSMLKSVMSSFNVRNSLNSKIWLDDVLDSKVRKRLLDIADEFLDFVNVKWVKPTDIILTGSLANYNWSKYSDFDLHIVMDFKKVDKRKEFVKEFFDSKKTLWNEQHEELKIYGFPVELYVQDIDEHLEAAGIYSLKKDKWVKEPERDTFKALKLDKQTIKAKSVGFMKEIDKLESEYKKNDSKSISNKVLKLWDKIKKTRKESLKTGNEMSIGNLVFKCLRRTKYLEKLMDLKYKTFDKENSIK